MTYHKIIGIDLGTTFSVVSAFNEETGKPEAFEVPGMQPPRSTFPSVVSISRRGKVLVGWPAKRNLAANPQNTVIEMKRRMGDNFQATLGGQQFNPQMISAMVLTELKKIAEKRIGEPVYDAVITVPAYFSDLQRQATEDAARIAQLNPRLLINEPTAAAIAYGIDKLTDEERIFVVYDLGGGTFDVSIILVAGTTIEVMGTDGDRITEWVFNQIERDFPGSGNLHGQPDLWARVKAAAEQTKIDLSGMENAVVDVPNLTPDINVYYDIDRDTFISLLQEPRSRPHRKEPIGLLDETIESVKEAFKSAQQSFKERLDLDVTMDDVTEFLLVGGSTRIPAVKQMLEQHFGRPVRFDSEMVDTAVSFGAAILGRTMDPMDTFEGEVVAVPRKVLTDEEGKLAVARGEVTQGEFSIANLDVVDVTGHSLGITLVSDRFHRLINKDTELPASETHEGFTTAADNQPAASIRVFQGEDPIAPNNTFLGELLIDGLDPRPMGYHMFDVTFALDISGVLGLTVKHTVHDDSRPPREFTKQLKSSGVTRLSRNQVEENQRRMQQILEKGFDSDMPPQPMAPQPQTPYQSQAPFQPQTPYPPHHAAPQPQSPTPEPTAAPPYQAPPEAQPESEASSQPESEAPPEPEASPEPPASTMTSPDGDLETRVPEDFRDVWQHARERVVELEGPRQRMLQSTIDHFEQAVQAGDEAVIHNLGAEMAELYSMMG
jgi:molecular chaperone DnaK